jgi:hypothetical protein
MTRIMCGFSNEDGTALEHVYVERKERDPERKPDQPVERDETGKLRLKKPGPPKELKLENLLN